MNPNKVCAVCNTLQPLENFIKCHTVMCPDGYSSVCNDCLENYLRSKDYDWNPFNKVCQSLNIPFIPKWVHKFVHESDKPFINYAALVSRDEYEGMDWQQYNDMYKTLERQHMLEEELPLLTDEKRRELQLKWGSNYDDEALAYLQDLFEGMQLTQNINGTLQDDQAKKICKISYELDCQIRAGDDFNKTMQAYDKLVQTAEFTPKNAKNAADFDSMGELVRWLERGGWKNKFYDGVTRDIVDETIQNIQTYNRRLYTNESGIGDEITRRIEALRVSNEKEQYYTEHTEYDLDNYENSNYDELINNDFAAEVEEGEVI